MNTEVETANPESSVGFKASTKRTVSKRANRGINPKYDSEIYLGLNTNLDEVPAAKPF